MEAKRDSWSARKAFLCAAIGSAVGLGNVWRFPNYCYMYGGGAFLLPYVLGLVLIGLPLLTLEFALGQTYRSGDIVAFGAMHKRLRGLGVGSVWCGFMVVCYYVIIIAYAVTYLVNSFRGGDNFPWSGGTSGFFTDKVIGQAPQLLPDGSLNRSTKLVPQTWVGVTFIWLAIYLCTFKGPFVVGRITYVTMLLPFALLIFLACFFGGLDGAGDGIELYIGKWQFKKLAGSEACGGRSCADAWPDAIAQVFFSLSITFGVMTAYASYNPRKQGVQTDAVVVSFLDALSSFIAGFAVFASVGVLAKSTGMPVEMAAGGSSGFGLVFISMPNAFQALRSDPYNFSMAGCRTCAILFYLMIVLLGIDSAFSLCEGFSTCMKDSRLLKGMPREALIGIICLVGYCISFAYTNDTGIYSLDVIDYYINVTMLFIGFMEAMSAGWFSYKDEQIARIGWPAWSTAVGTMIFTCIMAPRIGLGIGSFSEHAENGTFVGLSIGVLLFSAGIALACRLARKYRINNSIAGSSALCDVLLFNVETLRTNINKICGGAVGNFSIPMVWSLLIKFVIPPVLMFLLQLKMTSLTFGDYGKYHQWYQGWGIAVAFAPFVMLLVSIIYPEAYEFLMPEEEVGLEPEEKVSMIQEYNSPSKQFVPEPPPEKVVDIEQAPAVVTPAPDNEI